MPVHVGHIGTRFEVTIVNEFDVPLNISSATGAGSKQIRLLRPDDTVVVKEAAFVVDGTDGKIEAFSEDGDITVAGIWKGEAFIAITGWSGIVGEAGEFEFEVKANLTLPLP